MYKIKLGREREENVNDGNERQRKLNEKYFVNMKLFFLSPIRILYLLPISLLRFFLLLVVHRGTMFLY